MSLSAAPRFERRSRRRTRQQLVDQPGFQSHPGRVSVGTLEQLDHVLGHVQQPLNGHAAMAGDDLEIFLPQPADEILGGRLVGLGHRIADERLHRRLELADPEQVDIDLEFLQGFAEVIAVIGIAFDHQDTIGIQPDLVGQRCETIRALAQAVAVGQHGLAALPESVECRRQFTESARRDAQQIVGTDQHLGNIVVRGRQFECAHDIAQAGFRQLLAQRLVEGTFRR